MIRSLLPFAIVCLTVGIIRVIMGRGWLDAAMWWTPATAVLILHFFVRHRQA